uniref:Helicase C-terminal domain-containing protein n=1 Tax=Strongyloides stercoralis TaxID=6248 RepID=A0A0K0EMN0_STRER
MRLKKEIKNCCNVFRKKGYKIFPYYSELSKTDKKLNLELFNKSKNGIFVTTTGNIIGLHFKNLGILIYQAIPCNFNDFYQDIGRLCRNEGCGIVLLYVTPSKIRSFKLLQNKIKLDLTIESNMFDEINNDNSQSSSNNSFVLQNSDHDQVLKILSKDSNNCLHDIYMMHYDNVNGKRCKYGCFNCYLKFSKNEDYNNFNFEDTFFMVKSDYNMKTVGNHVELFKLLEKMENEFKNNLNTKENSNDIIDIDLIKRKRKIFDEKNDNHNMVLQNDKKVSQNSSENTIHIEKDFCFLFNNLLKNDDFQSNIHKIIQDVSNIQTTTEYSERKFYKKFYNFSNEGRKSLHDAFVKFSNCVNNTHKDINLNNRIDIFLDILEKKFNN